MKVTLSTHVLDTTTGKPAVNVQVRISHESHESGQWKSLAAAWTDDDGRIRDWPGVVEVPQGRLRLTFATAEYFRGQGQPAFFYPEVTIDVNIDRAIHHHVPLLLSPFGYTTYRGS